MTDLFGRALEAFKAATSVYPANVIIIREGVNLG